MNILIYTNALTAGGVESLLLNTISEADNNNYHFDLMSFSDAPNDWAYKFEEIGCSVYHMSSPGKLGFIKSILECRKFFKQGNYDVIHCQNGFGGIIPLIANFSLVGHKASFICHSHYDNYPFSNMTKKIIRLFFNIIPCKKLACSYGAGYELYGKRSNFIWLKNGIDTSRFSFNEHVRMEVKKELGLSTSEFVIGTVGRMEFQKNHEFLIRLFSIVSQHQHNSRLILIGDGELRGDIKSQVDELKLEDKVMFLGKRNDVYRLLQALDVFIMPTRFEGLSLALLEVQCSGLPCLTSDRVPPEAKILENFEMLPLERGEAFWSDRVLSYIGKKRQDGAPYVRKAGFDKVEAAKAWLGVYDALIDKNK